MMGFTSDAKAASSSIYLAPMSEFQPNDAGGIFIGKSAVYKRPVFLDPDGLINPHVAVVGTSGAGKTYLIKAIIAKRIVYDGYTVNVIDWAGEYSGLIRELGGVTVEPTAETEHLDYRALLSSTACIDLSALKSDAKRDFVSRSILHIIADVMHSERPDRRARKMLVVDEAWRMFPNRADIGALFREGRKYGLSIVVATQLVGDINNEILANCASLFIFRMQNESDYAALTSMGLITEGERRKLTVASVGSCLAIMGNSHLPQSRLFIERVEGLDLRTITIRWMDMDLQIPSKKFAAVTETHFGTSKAAAAVQRLAEASGGEIEVRSLIRAVIDAGLGRPEAVAYLRELGIPDVGIIRAFEAAKAASLGESGKIA